MSPVTSDGPIPIAEQGLSEIALASRAASPGDLNPLAAMNAGLIGDEGHPNPMDEPALRARMARWLESGAWRIDLFLVAGEVVGYAAFRRERDAARPPAERLHVRQFYIRPGFRRRGRPGLPVRIEVLEGNAGGRAFWRALGFRPHATTMEWQAPDA